MTLFAGPIGDTDKYELVEACSRGGEGEVWQAFVTIDSVRVPIALKIILPSNAVNLDTWHNRWLRQAELLKSISHPGLMTVREVFVAPVPHRAHLADPASRTLYLAMNWVEGESLPEWVSRRPGRDALESLRIVGGLSAAVDYLHKGTRIGQGMLHRDIKPANVIVTGAGPVLVDFGFVRAQGSEAPMTMVGSPAYMAPEVAAGLGYSEASDLYSLGATAFFALTGTPPNVSDVPQMCQALATVKGLEHRPDIHDHVLAMLSPDPVRRPTSAVDWAHGLATLSIVGTGTTEHVPRPPTVPDDAAQDADTGEPSPAASKRQRGWLIPTLAITLLTLAGTTIGWALSRDGGNGTDTDAAGRGTTMVPQTTGEPETADPAMRAMMPNLSGVSEADAIAHLAGLGVTDVEIEPVPSDAEPGTVVDQSVAPGTAIEDDTSMVLGIAVSQTLAMPAVTGLSVTEAETALRAFEAIDVVERDSAAAPGTVLEQDPGADDEVASSTQVTLLVARETPTPDFTGMTESEAAAVMRDLHGEIETVYEYDPDGADGELLSQSPVVGDPLTPTVTVTRVEGPGLILLEDMEALRKEEVAYSMDIEFDQGDLSGTRVIHALLFRDAYCCALSAGLAEYNLGRNFDRLRMAMGYDDNGRADGEMRVEIFGDGNTLFSQDFGLGDHEDVVVDISNVLRLEIRATTLCCEGDGLDEVLLLGQAELLGPAPIVARYRDRDDS